ncbi:trimeric intracellular cation channel family protein [Hydrogenophilus thermoluteolus]|uniref:trimeric intracellular cation channel family protein n=1 Tax=Hydrogenophilus thermoluteolus TaxID=297 RepID=UPI003F671423
MIGAQAALDAGANGFIAVIMGVMTASFGGLIRDIICNEIPMILHREIYATAAAAGAAAFVLTEGWLTHEMALMIGAAVAFSLRAMGIVRGWHLPAYPTLPE